MQSGPTPTNGTNGLEYAVLMVPQASYALGRGGIEVQQDRTIEALQRRGITVHRYDPWAQNITADVVHVFGSDYYQADIVRRLRRNGHRVVITSMFMTQHPIWQYRAFAKAGSLLPANTISLRQRALQDADRVITISEQERRDLQDGFGIDPRKVNVIANGIDERFFHASKGAFVERYGLDNIILCVGSIEPRKNQLTVANAVADLGRPVVFIGPPASHGGQEIEDYVRSFTELVDRQDNLHWIPGLDHDDPLLESAYAAADVHILVSTIEAQGLVTMEAVAAGARAVVSDLPQIRELFTSDVHVAPTEDPKVLRNVVQRAVSEPRHDWNKRERPAWLMSWDEVALRLDAVYRSVLTSDIA